MAGSKCTKKYSIARGIKADKVEYSYDLYYDDVEWIAEQAADEARCDLEDFEIAACRQEDDTSCSQSLIDAVRAADAAYDACCMQSRCK